MCTAIAIGGKECYFGRNMDWCEDFGLRPCIVPRDFVCDFRFLPRRERQLAMIGMARVEEGAPLFAEAVNEKGLAMAGLNFIGNAFYESETRQGRRNVCAWELILWLLGEAGSLPQAKSLIDGLRLIDSPLREDLPNAQLHWILSDKSGSLVLEARRDGLHVFPDPVGVLTNNPPFEHQLSHLSLFAGLSPYERESRMNEAIPELAKGFGTGAFGLPGDYSSPSRFVKTAWLVGESELDRITDEEGRVSHLFSILASVAPPLGSVRNREGMPHRTLYSLVSNTSRGSVYLRRSDSLNTESYRLADFAQGDAPVIL